MGAAEVGGLDGGDAQRAELRGVGGHRDAGDERDVGVGVAGHDADEQVVAGRLEGRDEATRLVELGPGEDGGVEGVVFEEVELVIVGAGGPDQGEVVRVVVDGEDRGVQAAQLGDDLPADVAAADDDDVIVG